MENEVKKSAGKVWLIPTIVAAVLLIGLVVFMVIMGKGTSALADGTVTLSEAVSPLQDGTAQLSDGVDAYTEGVDQVADGIEQLNDAAPALVDGVNQLDATLKAGLTEKQKADMVKTVQDTIKKSFADPNNTSGTAAIKAQATAQLTAKLNEAKPTVKQTLLGNEQFTSVVSAGIAAQVDAKVRPLVKQGVIATINADGSPLKALGISDVKALEENWNNDYNNALGGYTLGQSVAGNVNPQWATLTYSEFIDAMVAATIASDKTAQATLNGGLDAFAETVAYGMIDGVAGLAVPGIADSIAGAALEGALGAGKEVSVTVANQTMGTIREGIKPLVEGAPTLVDGIKQLFDGSQQLKENSQALRDGASQLKDAAPALIDGINQLKDGAKKVNGFTPIH